MIDIMHWGSIVAFLKKVFNWTLIKETFKEWSDDKASRLAAALAYYTATAIAPLLIGVLSLVGFFFSREQAQAQVVMQVQRYMGGQGAEIVQTILGNADQPDLAKLAGIISLVTLLWSASNIFAQLQDSLDTVWGVQVRADLSLVRKVQHKIFPFLTVLCIGVLLLVAVLASTALSAIGALVSNLIWGGALLWQVVNFFISLSIITLLFGLVFKILPDVEIAWRDVWPGAALTALLFVVGQFVLGWYLGRQSGSSVYGAAGSLIVLLLWLYYSAQIFLFGAEYTQVYATRYGEGVRPAKDAVSRDDPSTRKAAAQAAASGVAHRPAQPIGATYAVHNGQAARTSITPARSTDYAEVSMGSLVMELVDDGRRLVRQEIMLARTEISETVSQAARGSALVAGGGLLLYGGALFVLLAVPLLLWALVAMPLWFALLLIGLFVAFSGWVLMLSARRKLRDAATLPKQSLDSLRQDVETVKGHLAT